MVTGLELPQPLGFAELAGSVELPSTAFSSDAAISIGPA